VFSLEPNQFGELSTMPKSSITISMNTQPGESTSAEPTPMQPAIGIFRKDVRRMQREALKRSYRSWQLISRVDFSMESLEVGKPFDRQAMLVSFALQVPSSQQF
jgi:hypothetical protein